MLEKNCDKLSVCEGNMNHLVLVYTILNSCYNSRRFDGKNYSPDSLPWNNVGELRDELVGKQDRIVRVGLCLPRDIKERRDLERIDGLDEEWIACAAIGYSTREEFPLDDQEVKPYFLIAGKKEKRNGGRVMERFIATLAEELREKGYTHIFSKARFNSAVYHAMTKLGFTDPQAFNFSKLEDTIDLERKLASLKTVDDSEGGDDSEGEDIMNIILVREI